MPVSELREMQILSGIEEEAEDLLETGGRSPLPGNMQLWCV